MLFDTLDIPESLLGAQDDGKLVVFAGAGVSIGAPSNLPSFAELAELIAQRPLTNLERSRLDHFLGELKAEGRDVHALAVQALNRPGSHHTPLHVEIVRLFGRPEHVRIVTTNFDPHFTTVVRSVHPKPEGFLVIRGISDAADIAKDDTARKDSAMNAARALESLASLTSSSFFDLLSE